MSQREVMIILAHAHACRRCRERLLRDPAGVTGARPLAAAEREMLSQLKPEDFLTAESLARAAGVTIAGLNEYQDEAIVRLRHL